MLILYSFVIVVGLSQ